MEIITTEEVMYKLDRFQSIFGKIDKLGWTNLKITSADAGAYFTSMKFHDECQTCGVRIKL